MVNVTEGFTLANHITKYLSNGRVGGSFWFGFFYGRVPSRSFCQVFVWIGFLVPKTVGIAAFGNHFQPAKPDGASLGSKIA